MSSDIPDFSAPHPSSNSQKSFDYPHTYTPKTLVANQFSSSSPAPIGTQSKMPASLTETLDSSSSPTSASSPDLHMNNQTLQNAQEHKAIIRSTCIDMNFDKNTINPSSPVVPAPASTPFDTPKPLHHQEKTIDKQSMDYVIRSSIAGGLAGVSAKTLIAPLDRVKILFQTSNPEFKRFTGSWFGFYRATKEIYRMQGIVGLFQGHSATIIRIFPYAATKFVMYEQVRAILIPSAENETSLRRFMAGSISGVTSVFVTYPLDLIRVRLAFQTRAQKPVNPSPVHSGYTSGRFVQSIINIFNEPPAGHFSGTFATRTNSITPPAIIQNAQNWFLGLTNFYRGFLPTIIGMVPYAGVSFWAHDMFHDMFRSQYLAPYAVMKHPEADKAQSESSKSEETSKGEDKTYKYHREPLANWAQLTAGGMSGMLSQTASYPLEVVRRRIQVSGITGESVGILKTVCSIYFASGFKGFFVGLSIGYIKVVPMFACSFFVYERMKTVLGI